RTLDLASQRRVELPLRCRRLRKHGGDELTHFRAISGLVAGRPRIPQRELLLVGRNGGVPENEEFHCLVGPHQGLLVQEEHPTALLELRESEAKQRGQHAALVGPIVANELRELGALEVRGLVGGGLPRGECVLERTTLCLDRIVAPNGAREVPETVVPN